MITRVLAVALAAALALAGWYCVRANRAENTLANERAQIAQQIAAKADEARAEERRRTHRIQEAQDAEYLARVAAQADATRARSALDGLRKHADQLASSCAASDPGIAPSGTPTGAPGDLLADMLARVGAAAVELAEHADRARIAGQLCERAYDALTK